MVMWLDYMIYFFHTKEGIKVGRSKDPDNRLRAISTSCPHKARLVLAIETKNDVEVETELKHRLLKYKKNGEWFDCDFQTAFKELVALNPVLDAKPKLALESIPEMDEDFPQWLLRTSKNPLLQSQDIDQVWYHQHGAFIKLKRKHNGNLEAMIEDEERAIEEILKGMQELKETLKVKTP